jgi:hypothetical protein
MIENIENIKKEIQEYVEVKLDLLKLHIAEHLSRLLSNAATLLIAGFLVFLILLFISFAMGFFLGSLLQSNVAGFLCMAGFYFLVLILFFLIRKKIVEQPVIKAVVRFLFPKFSEYENKQ